MEPKVAMFVLKLFVPERTMSEVLVVKSNPLSAAVTGPLSVNAPLVEEMPVTLEVRVRGAATMLVPAVFEIAVAELRVMLLPLVVPIVYPPAAKVSSPRATLLFSVTFSFAVVLLKDAVSVEEPDGVPG